MYLCLPLFCIVVLVTQIEAFRVLLPGQQLPSGEYFKPNDRGFVGIYGDPTNFQRERINEGALETPAQELIYEGNSPRQACPGMVGPFSDGNFYCTAREFGYCDRRSGTCFCNTGYQGIDCLACTDSYFKLGNLCYPKKLCPNDCNGAGTCNFFNGTCSCFPHRTGLECEILLCSTHSPLCETCTEQQCLKCAGGFYLTLDDRVCSTCYDFDPRCAGCTKELGCTNCADSTLTSVRRSGYRFSDPRLPVEEDTREFSITLPFGTKSPESFAEVENYAVVTTVDKALRNNSISCVQGLNDDETFTCTPFEESHIVCGHFGIFSFSYPNYVISEKANSIRMTVRRSGGGYGSVFVNYFIRHITTNDSDLIPTAQYTTSQRLDFEDGVVEKSFVVSILDDNIVEENEVFQVVLETPGGGGSLGPQFRTNVTIIDDDAELFSPKLSKLFENTTRVVAGEDFTITVNSVIGNGNPMRAGGERLFGIIENYLDRWRNTFQRNSMRHVDKFVEDFGNGMYKLHFSGVKEQGLYQLRVYHAFPDSIKGEYFYDGFFDRLAVSRLDQKVNFTWGAGKLIPRGSDYITIRWSGAILSNQTGLYQFKVDADDHARLWLDGDLLLDHWHQQAVNLAPSREVFLEGDKLFEVVLEYRELQGTAQARLLWRYNNEGSLTVIPQENLFSLFEIDRSPVEVTIVSAATSPNRTECTGDGLYRGTVLKKSTFSFCPRDHYGNLRNDGDLFFLSSEFFTANLSLVSDQDISGIGPETIFPEIAYNFVTNCFDGSYTPERAGRYQLSIAYQNWWDEEPSHVAGSPFYLTVQPDKTSGPKSNIIGLDNPLYAEAGYCYNFTIVARDNRQNLRLQGGDLFTIYSFRVDFYEQFEGSPFPENNGMPSSAPSSAPTSRPTNIETYSYFSPIRESDSGFDIVRFGEVEDLGNGNYTAYICPVIAGIHEIHVLLNGGAVSNQPNRILDRIQSGTEALGRGDFLGQYVDQSPTKLIVSHTVASIVTTTAEGPGLLAATVGVPTFFTVTVRDPWDNVLRDDFRAATVTASLDKSPDAVVEIFNYNNGTFYIEYTPKVAGENIISVYVNGFQIRSSPFILPGVLDGEASGTNSFARGDGLRVGKAGVPSYFEVFSFDLDGNRKNTQDDVYVYFVTGANTFTGVMTPCPLPPDSNHPICDPQDAAGGHYFGKFTPTVSGTISVSIMLVSNITIPGDDDVVIQSRQLHEISNTIDVYLLKEIIALDAIAEQSSEKSPRKLQAFINNPNIVLTEVSNGPFTGVITFTGAKAENTDVSGTLYDNIAGIDAYVYLQFRDSFGNLISSSSVDAVEMVLLGVAGDWGTVAPYFPLQGLANEYYYKGFYSGYPNVYGRVTNNKDGTYTIVYNANMTGQYVLRLSLAETGLNATYFNTTSFGYLVDKNFNPTNFSLTREGIANNLGTKIGWTGDLGGLPNPRGSRGIDGSYHHKYTSKVEENIDIDLVNGNVNLFVNDGSQLEDGVTKFKFRDEFWSARFTGMITPEYAEMYKFYLELGNTSESTAQLRIGGRGNEFNMSEPGDIVIDVQLTGIATSFGFYNFTDNLYREFVLEYTLKRGDAVLQLYWESPSTPYSIVPSSAFTYWRNISFYNTTIAPNELCSRCSTTFGEALQSAQVGVAKSFLVYGRDRFGNLLQVGGDQVTMVAIGKDGVAFRGIVTDYGNSTYLVEYYPTQAGVFRMYVSIGCCAPTSSVGYPAEIVKLSPLLVADSPFTLTIVPASIDALRSVAVGNGLVGGIAGELSSFAILYRDLHNNPTTNEYTKDVTVLLTMFDMSSESVTVTTTININYYLNNATITYNLTQAGSYRLSVQLKLDSNDPVDIVGSPYYTRVSPAAADPRMTICRGIGLRQASTNKTANFEIQLFDSFRNNLEVGGDQLYVRLLGDAALEQPSIPVVPRCVDTRNGRYRCEYQPTYKGTHEIIVKLLPSFTHPGGNGLRGNYYNSASVGLANGENTLNPTLVYTAVDPVLSFDFPDGFIVPSQQIVNRSTGNVPLSAAGQSVRWEGYLVAPRDETYTISTRNVNNIQLTVYIDAVMVYDNSMNYEIINPIILVQSQVYYIRIEAVRPSVINSAELMPISFEVIWSAYTIKPHVIPTYFLYDSAEEVRLSPFPVTVY